MQEYRKSVCAEFHRYFISERNGILFLNPGALKGMARYSVRTYMILEFTDDGNYRVISGKIQD
jgi:predicted phosphodiesterase